MQQYTAYLADLVGFRVAPARLQIHETRDAWMSEDPVAAPDTLREPETAQDEAKVLEADRRIAASTENDAEYRVRVPHAAIVVQEPY